LASRENRSSLRQEIVAIEPAMTGARHHHAHHPTLRGPVRTRLA
jgi:hypothetical protein